MIPFIDYILKVNALLIVVFGFYYFFLRKETFFSAIRFYFLIGILGSLLLPLIKWKKVIYVQLQENRTFDQQFLLSINEEVSLSWWKQITPIEWLSYILLVSMLIMLMIFVYKFYKLLSHIKQLTITKYEEQKIKIDYMSKEAYSFWNWIVLPCNFKQIDNYKLIILHEKIHVVQKHSIDLLLINVVKSVFWFNPFLRFLERAIKLNLEYIVDEKVVSQQNSYDYQLTLVQFQQQTHSNKLVSSFGTSDLKKRIIKINQPKSKNMKRLKFLCIAPIIGCFFYLFQVEVNAKIAPKDHVVTVLDTLQISTVDENDREPSMLNKEELLISNLDQQKNDQEKHINKNENHFLYIINEKEYTAEEMNSKTDEELGINTPTRHIIMGGDEGEKRYGKKGKRGAIVIESVSSEDFQLENTLSEDFLKKKKADFNEQKESLKQEMETKQKELVESRRAEVEKRREVFKQEMDTKQKSAKNRRTEAQRRIEVVKQELDVKQKELIESRRAEVEKRRGVLNQEIEANKKKLQPQHDAVTLVSSINGINSYKINIEDPLYLIDGKEVEESSLKNIKPNTIEQMNILKGKEAVEKYGVKGEKGVIEIITKN